MRILKTRIPYKIFIKSGSLVLFLTVGIYWSTFAQGKLSGFVVDEEFNEPLEKAVVNIPGTLISVLTDQQGKFSLDLIGGNYYLEVNYPGYFKKKYNMAVSDGVSTPMFVVKLQANAVGRTKQRDKASMLGRSRQTQATEDFSTWQIFEQKGNQEFSQLLHTVPSVTVIGNGSGFSDSEIGFRGNDASYTSYAFNGILLNSPETGKPGTLLSGLTDWAGYLQVVNGIASNQLSQTRTGGLVNVFSYTPHEKKGVELTSIYGNEGFLKTSATVHSGLSKKKMASSIQVSRTMGDGLAQNTNFEQYGIFVNLHKEFNHKHTLNLNLNGIIQEHNSNQSDTIGAYNLFTMKYNGSLGMLNNQKVSLSTNYERSPLISLTHFWQYRRNTLITSQIFARFNRSAKLYPDGIFENKSDSLPREEAGFVFLNMISDWNRGLPMYEMETIRQANAEGKFINSEKEGISLLNAVNRENNYGFRTTLTHQFNKELEFKGGLDLNHYKGTHFSTLHNLLGADGYLSFSDINRPDGFVVDKWFPSGFCPAFDTVDKTNHFYETGIQSGGINLQINYQNERLYSFIEASADVQRFERTDHFFYLDSDPAQKVSLLSNPGFTIQTGIRLHFAKYHFVYLSGGISSDQPYFETYFPTKTNWENKQATNEKLLNAEFGYTIFSRRLKFEALAYYSQITNRPIVRRTNLNLGDVLGLINGVNETHQGIELKTSYKFTRNFQLNVNGSLGDWKYTNDPTAQLYDKNNQLKAENELWLKDLRIANAPQLKLFAEAEYRWANNFYVRLNYSRSEQMFAPFGVYDFKNLASRTDFKQWELPAVDLLGLSGNYLLSVRKSLAINLIFGAQNLLDAEYIEQTSTNMDEENVQYTRNQVFYGTGRTWFVGMKIQF